MRTDKVASRKGAHERELTGHNSRGDDTGELARVGTGLIHVGSLNSEHLKTSTLSRKDGTSSDGSDLEGRHVDGHVEVLSVVDGLHKSHAGGRLDVLGGVLSTGKEESGNDVGSMGVESSERTSHGGTDKVLGVVDVADVSDSGLENALHDISGDDDLSHDRLATALDPVDGTGLLVGTHVSREGEDLEGEARRELVEGLVDSLGDHVHAHGVTGAAAEAKVDEAASVNDLDALETSEARGGVEPRGNLFKVLVNEGLDLGGDTHVGDLEDRGAGDSVSGDFSLGTSGERDGLASTGGTGDQGTLGGGERNVELLVIDNEGSGNTDGDGDVSDDVLSALSVNDVVVVVLVGELLKRGSNLLLDDAAADLDSTLKVTDLRLELEEAELASANRVDEFGIREVGVRSGGRLGTVHINVNGSLGSLLTGSRGLGTGQRRGSAEGVQLGSRAGSLGNETREHCVLKRGKFDS